MGRVRPVLRRRLALGDALGILVYFYDPDLLHHDLAGVVLERGVGDGILRGRRGGASPAPIGFRQD